MLVALVVALCTQYMVFAPACALLWVSAALVSVYDPFISLRNLYIFPVAAQGSLSRIVFRYLHDPITFSEVSNLLSSSSSSAMFVEDCPADCNCSMRRRTCAECSPAFLLSD